MTAGISSSRPLRPWVQEKAAIEDDWLMTDFELKFHPFTIQPIHCSDGQKKTFRKSIVAEVFSIRKKQPQKECQLAINY